MRKSFDLMVLAIVSCAARLIAVRGASATTMDPDAAHFLNVARCFVRGQGFSNPGAWPAWMNPVSLPMPETFKEPGFPFAISVVSQATGDLFSAGILVSLVAGIALPLVTYVLAMRLSEDRQIALVSGLLIALNPLAISRSGLVMVESAFTFALISMFLLVTMSATTRSRWRSLVWSALAGVALGFAFLLRTQTLLALPAIVALSLSKQPRGRAAAGLGIALVAAVVTASPFLVRNIRLFGVPLYSDVAAYGVWPYVDQISFSHGLDRPPAPVTFAMAHMREVLVYSVKSLIRFTTSSLPNLLVGNPVWMIPFGAGLLLATIDWRRYGFIHLFFLATLVLVLPVHWDERYFASITPLLCIITALGAVWIWKQLADSRLGLGIAGRHLMIAALVVAGAAQIETARRIVATTPVGENASARALADWIRSSTRPDEAALVLTTSYYSWFADRPTVHLIVASEEVFDATMRRLKVRVAALPTDRLEMLARRFPEGRLPSSLVQIDRDAVPGMTRFAIHLTPAATAQTGLQRPAP